MLADAFHNLSDVLAVGIALQCERLKRRPDSASTAYLTFGAKRFEVVGCVRAVYPPDPVLLPTLAAVHH